MQDCIELIEKIKNGDEESFNILLEGHKNIIYKLIYSQNLELGDYMIDIDSLFQEGCLALYNSIFTYEQEKGMSFTSYAYMVIRARISTYIKANKRKMDECRSIDNFDNIDYHISLTSMNVNDNPVEYHHELLFEEKLNSFVSHLKDEDRTIIEMRLENMSYKDISERLQINTKRVDNRLSTLKKRLKIYLDETVNK